MKFPKDLSGADVIRALERLGFEVLRQSGSHVRLGKGTLRVTVPNHRSVAQGTLKNILRQAGIEIEDLTASLE